ncbi:hypothetical protein [Kitasatospora sp. MAP12-15]|uniref:hypothetical protein n=1 Tax=unclassified Kitasatospora TaxID=2633591 RepID=UPI003D1C5A13
MAIAGPASAAGSGDTTVTFTVTVGAISITVPSSAGLPAGVPGGTTSGQLGAVTVTDNRALLNAFWTSTVSSTDYTTGGGTAPETITKSNVSYWSGPATATTGNGTFTPGQATSTQKQALTTAITAFSMTGGSGDNSATWNPTLVVAVPASAVGGLYTGTVTHSVA